MMGLREFTKSGAYVATVFALVVVLVPFGIEEIGETTGLFEFPVKKTVFGLFSTSSPVKRGVSSKPVDWERYRHDLEAFSEWTGKLPEAVLTLPREPSVINVVEKEVKPVRRIWSVPVASCTAGGPDGLRKGYVFISGFDRPFDEGAFIAPSEELCGYEIVSIGERVVWLRAVFTDEGDSPMGIAEFPEFTRVDGESLVKGNRRYVARDAFPLASGGWLMIDSFLPPNGTVFCLLDENRRIIASFLCIVIGEKGGR